MQTHDQLDNGLQLRPAHKPQLRDPRLVFALQKRHNSHEYFALQIEVRGVLKSWVVPKGPSMNPQEPRLAIETDTQKVTDEVLWDKGWYEPVGPGAGPNDRMVRGLRRGAIRLILHGKKLKGGFSLARFREPDQWLITKRDDMYARTDVDE